MRLLAVVVGLVVLTAGPAAAGPREDYEASLGSPPRVVQPAGGLGHAWQGTPTRIAGTSIVSKGELILQDRPFDDTGADTVPGNGDLVGMTQEMATLPLCSNSTSYRHGDFAYPSDAAYMKNAADLVETRIAADASSTYVLFQLQTLIDPAKTAVELHVDSRVLRVTGTGADVDGAPVASHADAAANTFEARIPVSVLPHGVWKLASVAGLWDGSAVSDVVDLGWVPNEPVAGEPNCWQDAVQSELIAAGGAFPAVEIDVAQLRAGRDDGAPPLVRGAMTRLYQPLLQLGEGIVGQPRYGQSSSASVYRGSMQPYSVYVPDSYNPAAPSPLILLLHCLSCNHTTFQWAAWPGLKELAEARGAPIVTPLAYGEGGHYEGEAEVDVFEVLRDVRARYNVDGDRMYITGMSMGALGSYRLGLLYPDLWARALGVGNYTNPFCVTPSQKLAAGCTSPSMNYFALIDNGGNVPWGVLNGVFDELTPVTGAREIADRFAELGYGYRYWEYATQFHNPSLHGTTTDVTNPWLGDFRRVANPARVVYSLHRDMDRDSASFGIVHDRAYWLRDIRMAQGASAMRVEAVSGRGMSLSTKPFAGSGTSQAGPWTGRGLDPAFAAVDSGNTLRIVATGVSSMTVRLADVGLGSEGLALDVQSDVPLALSFVGGGVVSLPAGSTSLVVGGESLPASGGWIEPGVAALLAAAGLALRRRR